jgi:hypothetical protein
MSLRLRIAGVVGTGALMVLGLGLVGATPAFASGIEIHDDASGGGSTCLTGNANVDPDVTAESCTDDNGQQWHVVYVDTGVFEVENAYNQCMTATGAVDSNGADIVAETCLDYSTQHWTQGETSGKCFLNNIGVTGSTDMVLGLNGGSTKRGTHAIQRAYLKHADQYETCVAA